MNRVASLFITHVLNTLDDTVISKKKIIHDLLMCIDEGIEVKGFQNIFIGIQSPLQKRYFDADDIAAFTAYQQHSTSKKAPELRRKELIQAVCKPLENFFYEKLSTHLADVTKVPLLAKVLAMRIELGDVEDNELIDELIRQVSKKADYDGGRGILMGDMNLHRMLKELVQKEAELGTAGALSQ